VCAQLNSDDARDGGSTNAVRQAVLLAVDLHSLLWLSQGLYYHVALRLTGVKLMQQLRPRPAGNRGGGGGVSEVSLRALRWVLGLRLALLGVNATALFVKHWRRSSVASVAVEDALCVARIEARAEGRGSRGGSGSARIAGEARDALAQERAMERRLRIAGMQTRACPLCMDVVRCPAVTPCGHVYCWGCIQGLCVRAEASGESGGGSAALALARCKCPVCRTEFEARAVRAIM
jgi:hypothetical protein